VVPEVEVSSYKVVYQRDESGSWIARVPRVPGCHTYGRTIDQARERVREALDLWVRDAAHVSLVDEVRLPTRLRASVSRAHRARKRADAEQAKAQESAASAATRLTTEMRLSLRDAGEVLGLSRQRVQQLVAAKRSRRSTRAR